MPIFRSACPYDCPEGCSLLVKTDGEKIAAVTGDPANPYTGGVICGKMRRLPEAVNSPERILTPLRRTGKKGEGKFAPISWQEAAEEIAGRWKELIARYGAETILPYSYAGTMGAVHRNCGEGFFRALGADPDLMADCFRQPMAPGDYLLLCSDGLSNVVTEQEILYEVIYGGEEDTCCRRLLEIAMHRGAPDNVTAVLICAGGEDQDNDN